MPNSKGEITYRERLAIQDQQLAADYYARQAAAEGVPAAAAAAAAAATRSGQPVRGVAPESRSESYTIAATGVVETCFGHLHIISGLAYVHGAVSSGVPAAAAGDCYIGRQASLLTEVRVVGDQAVPYVIDETPRSEFQPARLYVSGTAGDIITLVYRPS